MMDEDKKLNLSNLVDSDQESLDLSRDIEPADNTSEQSDHNRGDEPLLKTYDQELDPLSDVYDYLLSLFLKENSTTEHISRLERWRNEPYRTLTKLFCLPCYPCLPKNIQRDRIYFKPEIEAFFQAMQEHLFYKKTIYTKDQPQEALEHFEKIRQSIANIFAYKGRKTKEHGVSIETCDLFMVATTKLLPYVATIPTGNCIPLKEIETIQNNIQFEIDLYKQTIKTIQRQADILRNKSQFQPTYGGL